MKMSILRGEVETCISDGSLCWLVGWDGLGLPDLTRHTERGPNQHGDNDRGFTLAPRYITLALSVVGEGRTHAAAKADLLARYRRVRALVKPVENGPLALRIYTDDGQMRQIDCHFSGDMKVRSTDQVHRYSQRLAVTLRCPDPTFYDPVAKTITLLPGAGAEGFEVPHSVPHAVGASKIDQTVLIQYGGEWRAYPWIRITGPVTDPVIENLSSGRRLDFTGTTIAAGDWYDIELRYGAKTITDRDGTYQGGKLVDPSDVVDFAIEADPEAPGGQNLIRFTGDDSTGATRLDILYNERYQGE